ncbi:MAG: hypothetical protein WD749_10760 [Phycisphaerales bacterium]
MLVQILWWRAIASMPLAALIVAIAFVGTAVGAAAWILVVRRLIQPWFERTALTAMVTAGFCPSCGYGLAELNPEPDGCRVCPECGAAWRMEP